MALRERRVRYQLFLPLSLSAKFEELAAKPGVSKSQMLADAVQAWLTRRGASEIEDRFGHRLDRMTTALGRIERDGQVMLESLALFVRYELAIHPPLADGDEAGHALGRQRFDAFVAQVGRQIAAGRKTLVRKTETGQ